MPHFVTATYDGYERRLTRDRYVRDHYTGEAQEKAIINAEEVLDEYRHLVAATDDRALRDFLLREKALGLYLHRRIQGEHIVSYAERVKISRFPGHMAAIVDSFVSSIFAVEHNIQRTWAREDEQAPIGSFAEKDSLAHTLKHDLDGEGTAWLQAMRDAATRFTLEHRVWHLVEGVTGDTHERVLWIDEKDVRAFIERKGVIREAIIRERDDYRESLQVTADPTERYLYLWPDRYQRWEAAEGGGVTLIEEGQFEHTWYHDADRTIPCTPLQKVELGLKRDSARLLARGQNSLYNQLSDARHILRVANHPKLRGKDVSDEMFEHTAEALSRGDNILQGDWDFIGPDTQNARAAYEIYAEEVRSFYTENLQQFNDAAREVTATERRQEDQRGRQAYLTLLSNSLDELENRIMFFLAQATQPDRPDLWQVPEVNRSTDFAPQDPFTEANLIKEMMFGEDSTLPVPVAVKAQAVLDVARMLGYENVTFEEVEAEVEAAMQDQGVTNEIGRRMASLRQQINGGGDGSS